MRNWKRFLAIGCMAILLTSGFTVPAMAESPKSLQAANHLNELGLFSGTGINKDGIPIYELDRVPTRQEAVVMLVRLLGKEAEAATGNWEMPFTDVAEWARPAVGYAYNNKLTGGISATQFGGNNPVTASQYISFALRALGYNSNDFQWDKAWELSDKIGLTQGEYHKNTTIFTRGDVAIISDCALKMSKKGTNETLMQSIAAAKPVTQPIKDSVSIETISYDTLVQSVSLQNNKKVATSGSFKDFESYLIKDASTAGLVTTAEIEKMQKNTGIPPKTISYNAAVEDVNLLFRSLHAGYGAYYYFGEQNYEQAEKEVMNWLKGQKTVNVSELENVIAKSLIFMKDGHSRIGGTYSVEANRDKWYRSYFCDVDFGKDSTGYYTMINNDKWYYSGSDNINVLLHPVLKENGDIVYSPVQFCAIKDAKESSTITLKKESSTKQVKLQWAISKNYIKVNNQSIFASLKQNNIAYLALRSCPYDTLDPDRIAFEKSGSDVKNAKLVLIDLRGNGGGERAVALNWFRNYTGEYPQLPEVRAFRKSVYTPHNSNISEYEISYRTSGKFHSNDIPIIVLTDSNVASSGEYLLLCLRSMDNVMVIGSNTGGYQLGGAKGTYKLPNSKISFKIGTGLEFVYNTNNVDLKGWEPDIWCDPSSMYDAVLNMCEKADLVNEDELAAFRQACEQSEYLF